MPFEGQRALRNCSSTAACEVRGLRTSRASVRGRRVWTAGVDGAGGRRARPDRKAAESGGGGWGQTQRTPGGKSCGAPRVAAAPAAGAAAEGVAPSACGAGLAPWASRCLSTVTAGPGRAGVRLCLGRSRGHPATAPVFGARTWVRSPAACAMVPQKPRASGGPAERDGVCGLRASTQTPALQQEQDRGQN